MKSAVVCFITTSSAAESRKIARTLVEEKIAACVSVVPGVTSRYRWKGRVETAREQLLIVKTLSAKVPALVRRVKSLHAYAVPEVIALPIRAGNRGYMRWLEESLR